MEQICEKFGYTPRAQNTLLQPFAVDAYPFSESIAGTTRISVFTGGSVVILAIESDDVFRAHAIVTQICRREKRSEPIDLNHAELRKQLIELYAQYLENPDDEEMLNEAQVLGSTYDRAHDLLPTDISEAISPLVNIGIALDPRPTPERARAILHRLQQEDAQ